MNLRARTAGTRVAHLPKVVVFVAIDDMVFREELFPDGSRLVVAVDTLFGTTLEHGGVEVGGVQFQYVYQILPSP